MNDLIRALERVYLEPPDNAPILYDFTGGEIYCGETYYSLAGEPILPDNFEIYLASYYNVSLPIIARIIEDSGADLDVWIQNLGATKMSFGDY